ncbi:MAG: hypothetical protein ABIA75_06605 [Candidatus Neomarinimicrobiota bacterium]
MSTAEKFDLNRFWHLVKNDLLTNYRTILIGGGAALGLLFFINIISILSDGEVLVPLVFYPLMLFIGGYIVTSLAFQDLHHPQRSYVYLTLPASNLEKFLSKLVLTTVGYIFGTLVLYFLFSLVMSLLNLLLFSHGYPLFNPFDRIVWITIGIYTITQSIFMLGAAYFRKNALIKTIFSLHALAFAVIVFTGIVFRIVFWDLFNGFEFNAHDFDFPSNMAEKRLENFFLGFAEVMKFIFFYLLAPFLWLITYLRVKETEV